MKNIGILEIFLFQLICYLIASFIDPYMGTFLIILFASISILILIVALVSEGLDPSRVPRSYFHFMIASILAPILAYLITSLGLF